MFGSGALRFGHEAGHLDHPEPALRIPVHDDRILDERLAGDELEVVAGRHRERLQRFRWRQRRRPLGALLNRWRPLIRG